MLSFAHIHSMKILNKLKMQPMNVRIANVDIYIDVLLLSVCYQNAFHTLHVTKTKQNIAKGNSSNTPHILQLDFVSHDVWINNNGISFLHFYHEKQDLNKKCSEWGLWQNKFSTCCSFFNEIIFVELQTCLTSIQQCKLQIKRLKFAIMQKFKLFRS